jgi:hypothetical protein
MRRRSTAVAATAVFAMAGALLVGSSPATAAPEARAPITGPSTSAAGADLVIQPQAKRNPKVAKGTRGNKIRVSKVRRLPAGGSFITVKGSGFDPRVGVYVGLCVTPRPGQKPSPCGGGADTDGSSQASAWVSSNPPSYGSNLATKYGRNGSFKVRIFVGSRISSSVDCRTARCSITTRADHTRSTDRTWDLAVPVRFTR